MGRFYSTVVALAALPLVFTQSDGSGPGCDMLTADEVRSMGNNSLFTRWRPYSHFTAPAGWMNDPCGPMYDPVRDVYHLFYQWHPEHINWGNISWGYATSKDLVTFTDYNGWQDSQALALGPTGNGSYNGLGIFSGTAQPVNQQGEVDGTLLLFYTSVSKLPTNWALPYLFGTETQSIAISTDGGTTWEDYEGNPVIDATVNTAPMYWNITGFRDPFVEPLPQLDDVLGVSEPHYYSVFGSGIKGVGPRIPLWSAPASDLTDWTFLGALWEPEANSSLGPVLSTRTYGFNFEVSGLFALPDSNGDPHYFVNMGAEGVNLTYIYPPRASLWNEGLITRRENGSAEFEPIAGGLGDWGISYALTSFNDTKNNRRVQVAWAPEDIIGDSGLFSAKEQGFQGAHTLMRELFVHEVDGVVDPDGELAENRNAVLTEMEDGTYSARTLGVRPLPDVVKGLRDGSTMHSFGKEQAYNSSEMLKQQGAASVEIKATISSATDACGLIVAASPDMTEYTTIMYEPSNHTLLVERLHSSTIVEFNNLTTQGYFYPYTIMSGGNAERESITMDVFVDGSLLEVYLNDRFALATRIYPSMECSTGYGVYVAAGSTATFESVQSWENLLHVWSDRPANSSSRLVFDTAAETNDYVWWPGN
ncbi:hypothetical protein LTR37_003661 [Vermiconidia calcicola]|uniref:Uncharacterized protein n=1 Tax=Vermiconidia calcicola TaxID=1690605 RepID=A0ACC3NP56_9PEZI|nr:hypothetical protein LTR37_003661 [Vermiconidia calcicola]